MFRALLVEKFKQSIITHVMFKVVNFFFFNILYKKLIIKGIKIGIVNAETNSLLNSLLSNFSLMIMCLSLQHSDM